MASFSRRLSISTMEEEEVGWHRRNKNMNQFLSITAEDQA